MTKAERIIEMLRNPDLVSVKCECMEYNDTYDITDFDAHYISMMDGTYEVIFNYEDGGICRPLNEDEEDEKASLEYVIDDILSMLYGANDRQLRYIFCVYKNGTTASLDCIDD